MLNSNTEKEFFCPKCQAVIPVDDINVSTDMALCRHCGNVSSFAAIVNPIDTGIDINTPPRGIRLENGDNNEYIISYHRFSPVLLFLIPFTALWSGLSMWGIYGKMIVSGKYKIEEMLFGLPFLFGTIILLSVIIYLLFGITRIVLDHGKGTVFIGIATFGWTRNFNYNQNSILGLKTTSIRVNNVTQTGIYVTTGERDFVFGTMIREDAKKYIAALIQRKVRGQKNNEISRS